MYDALFVRILQRIRDLRRDPPGVFERHGALRRFALDQLHDDRAVFHAVDVRDVGMIQRRENLGLAPKTRHAVGIARESFRQHLQRHVAFQLRVASAIDFAHPAGPYCRKDLVWAKSSADNQRHARAPDERDALIVVGTTLPRKRDADPPLTRCQRRPHAMPADQRAPQREEGS
jgi:hypothetical protein